MNKNTAAIASVASGDLTSDLSISAAELRALLDLAREIKGDPAQYSDSLKGRYLGLLFEKPSLRTRLTFELAIKQLGGDAIASVGPIGDREPVKDIARNLDRWMSAIVARTFSQSTIEELAEWSSVPVINALSDMFHPCQSFADFQTIEERFESLRGLKLCFSGDGNNVAHSLLLNGARLGVNVTIACPEGYEPNASILAKAAELAAQNDCKVTVTNDAVDGVRAAHVVYTDVWASMGQESEAEARQKTFAPFQVNAGLMSAASKEAIFLHCLPAKRGLEVTDAVMESPQSLIFDQAENRLHAQKALLVMLLSW